MPVEFGHVYTLELGAFAEGAGFIGLEEMVVITETGCEWITNRQLELNTLY